MLFIIVEYPCSEPPPEASASITRDTGQPEARRRMSRGALRPEGPALDRAAASGTFAGVMDGRAMLSVRVIRLSSRPKPA